MLDSSGKEISSYDIPGNGVYGPFTLQLQDAYGNVAVAPADGYFDVSGLAATSGPTEIRLAKDGVPVDKLYIKAGASSVTFWVAVSGLQQGPGAVTFNPPQIP